MDEVNYGRAGSDDRDDVLDFADFVFSQAHVPHDFGALLPKLYSSEIFMNGIHYLAREDRKIKAMVGSYPLTMEFRGGTSLPGRGIGAVSVHPRARSRGYMKTLMGMALEDMRKDGMVWSCLGGQRQRYEYFGYTPAGSTYFFSIREANIRHTLGNGWTTDLALRQVKAEDKSILDHIQAMHETKTARLYRNREKLFDTLASWNARIFAVTQGSSLEGYLVCKPSWDIDEINLKHPARMAEALGLLIRVRGELGGPELTGVLAGPHETEKLAVLSKFAENCRLTSAYQFCILDFKRFIEPFAGLRTEQGAVPEGSFVLRIEGPGGGTFLLFGKGGQLFVTETSSAPDAVLNSLEATRLLFGPVQIMENRKIRESVFLRGLLPLPLFFEHVDGV